MRRLLGLALVAAAGASAAFAAAPPDPAALYRVKCAVCHSPRGWASAVLARRVPAGQQALTDRKSGLPRAYVQRVVRRGVGAMPGFTPTDVTDTELAALAAWLER